MSPEDILQIKPAAELQRLLVTYLDERMLNRAESSDMSWSRRLLVVTISLIAGQKMTRSELTAKIADTLAQAPSSYYQELYVDDLLNAVSTLVWEAPPPPVTPVENAAEPIQEP